VWWNDQLISTAVIYTMSSDVVAIGFPRFARLFVDGPICFPAVCTAVLQGASSTFLRAFIAAGGVGPTSP